MLKPASLPRQWRRLLSTLALVLFLVLASGMIAPPLRAAPAPATGLLPVEELERILSHARLELNSPAALLYVAAPDRGAWYSARGIADVATGRSALATSRFRIASVTKSFVAVVTIQLVEEGWLSLDQSVEHWLPGLVPGGHSISVRQLLNHSSGMPNYLTHSFVKWVRNHPEHNWNPYELVGEALRYPHRFAPGEPGRWEYSNTNYILLGLIIERVTGHSLDHEIRHRIIEPLQLGQTSFAPPHIRDGGLLRGYAGPHDYTDINMSFAWAAGGLESSTADLGRYAAVLYGGQLLSEAGLARMIHDVGGMGVWGARDTHYGLGSIQRSFPAGAGRVLARGHTGALVGYRSAMWHFPESGVVIVAVLNRFESDPNYLVERTLDSLVRHGVVYVP
jgi:D-alanyl-D-alanine carboxypeptidase